MFLLSALFSCDWIRESTAGRRIQTADFHKAHKTATMHLENHFNYLHEVRAGDIESASEFAQYQPSIITGEVSTPKIDLHFSWS